MHLYRNIVLILSLTLASYTSFGNILYIQETCGKNLEVKVTSNDSISSVIAMYHQGFEEKDEIKIRETISDQLIMFNGNFSGNPIDWQAHLFLNGYEIDEWIAFMLNQAGPFENEFQLKKIDLRGNSAIAITEESGRNKFRGWQKEEVAYLLGKVDKKWKLVGVFIKDIKNPE